VNATSCMTQQRLLAGFMLSRLLVLKIHYLRAWELNFPTNIGSWVYLLASLMPLAGCPGRPAEGARQALVVSRAGAARVVPKDAVPRPVRYYVSPLGSDQNKGTSAKPFVTIQRAADVVRPGDTVVVRPGLYTGGERIVTVEKGGAAGAWITFRSEQKWGAVLDGREGKSLEGWYFGPAVGYVRIEGFEIRNLQEHGFDSYGGGVHDLMIAANHVHDIGRNCTDTSNGRTGASLGAETRGVTFDGNVWHDIGRFAPGEQGCAPETEYFQNHDHGIYVADADDITIRNNVFYNFRRGWPVHRYYSRRSPIRGLSIQNNTFVGANPYRSGQIIVASPTSDLTIENNIFYAPRSVAILFEGVSSLAALVRYNMVSSASIQAGAPNGVIFEHNWEGVDPGFSATGNYRLGPDSPAIDAGLPLAGVTSDADGVRRPRGKGYDLGAYER
jgi:parallel beta helix pectate lyase-like protein/pectate lyase-like protein